MLLSPRRAGVLPFLVKASISLDEGVCPLLLQLLQCALCGAKAAQQAGPGTSSASPTKPKKEKDKDKDKEKGEGQPRCLLQHTALSSIALKKHKSA